MPDSVGEALRIEEVKREPRMEPWPIFWREQHAAICKAAERVTRQQRRHTERQQRKAR